jgi:hypothetical protein
MAVPLFPDWLATDVHTALKSFPDSKDSKHGAVEFVLAVFATRIAWEGIENGVGKWKSGQLGFFDFAGAILSVSIVVSVVALLVLPDRDAATVYLFFGYMFLCPALAMLYAFTLFLDGLIKKEFMTFRLVASRRIESEESQVNRLLPAEKLHVAWFLLWRGLGLSALVDVGLFVACAILLIPFSETDFARSLVTYLGKWTSSTGLALSAVFVGFPLTVPLMVQKSFHVHGATVRVRLVRLTPHATELFRQQSA